MSFHVFRVGWVYTGLDLLPAVHRPLPEAVHADPEREREVLGEILRARRERENPPWSPWPEPEIPMRVVDAGAAPGGVARLLSRLRSAEWRSVVTYARGTLSRARDGFTGTGASKRPKHYPAVVVGSWAIRAARGNRRAVAIWHERAGKLESQGVLTWGDAPARWVGVQEFEKGM